MTTGRPSRPSFTYLFFQSRMGGMSEKNTNWILLDFSRVLLFPTDKNYTGALNDLYREIIKDPKYDYFRYFKLNKELITFLESLAPKNPLAIFTSEIIQDDPAVQPFLKPIFSHVISAKNLGVSKTNEDAYLAVARQLGTKPQSILYVDDKLANVEAASRAGCVALQYILNSQSIKDIQSFVN